eukprot:11208261-Prorocentrum_lima.AAC.1
MAHAGQVDDLAHDDLDEKDQELSNRQGVNMMKGLIHMMKQQLQEIRLPSPPKKEITVQQDHQEVR